MLAKGTEIEVRIKLALPADATDADIEEWLQFELNYHCEMKTTNPLQAHEVEAMRLYWSQTTIK